MRYMISPEDWLSATGQQVDEPVEVISPEAGPNEEMSIRYGDHELYLWEDGEVEYRRWDGTKLAHRVRHLSYWEPEHESKPMEVRQCPCEIADEPCHPNCPCVKPHMSHPCYCCAHYGSAEQKKKAANRIVEACMDNRWAMACRVLGIPPDSSGGKFRDAIAELKHPRG